MTPTTSLGSSSSSTVRPTTFGSPPNMRTPRSVAQDDHARGAGTVVGLGEHASHRRVERRARSAAPMSRNRHRAAPDRKRQSDSPNDPCRRPCSRTTCSGPSSRGSSRATAPCFRSHDMTGPARAEPDDRCPEKAAAAGRRGWRWRTMRSSRRYRAPLRESRSWRSPAFARACVRCSANPAEDIEVNTQRIRRDVDARAAPQQRSRSRARGVAQLACEHGGHFPAVFGAKRRGIEPQESAVEPHGYVLRGENPLTRASRSSSASRCVSARATALPNGVIR